MVRIQLKSKIHRAIVTDGNIEYEGSISIDQDLLKQADIWKGEKVLVTSITSGARLETYAIPAPSGSKQIVLNGAAAHLIKKGERVTIMAWGMSEEHIEPAIIICNDKNEVVRRGMV